MKKILLLFLILFGGSQIYSQQVNRIRFYQLPKDVNSGSVLISSPTDSNITFSRDLYINYNLTDTLLIFNGDTVAVTSTLPSLLNNYVTISGTETITGTKTFTNPIIGDLEGIADTALAIFTLPSSNNVDYVLTMADPNEGLYIYNRTLNDFTYNPFTYMLKVKNYHFNTGQDTTGVAGNVLTYRNGQISLESAAGTTYNNINEIADTLYVAKYLDVDTSTLYVDADNNRVGIGTTSPTTTLQINKNSTSGASGGLTIKTADSDESLISVGVSTSLGRAFISSLQNGTGTQLPLDFITGNTSTNVRMRITSDGNVGIGDTSPGSKLDINGSATNSSANNEGSDATIDFSLSNISYTSSTSSTITLTNIKDGGAYTLIMTGNASTDATFSATNFTFKYMGTVPRTSGKHHIYSFIVVGSVVYVTMGTEN